MTVPIPGSHGHLLNVSMPVKHLVLCRIERRPPKLDLDIYPYLPRANVATTAAASYMSLLQEAGKAARPDGDALGGAS